MDIIVTCPKDYNFELWKTGPGDFEWHLAKAPIKTKQGDKIYFVWRGEIRYVADIVDVGLHTIYFKNAHELDRPWEKMQSFQGFRYYKNGGSITDS